MICSRLLIHVAVSKTTLNLLSTIMKTLIIRIIALVAAMVLGLLSCNATSLSEQTGQAYCLSCAYDIAEHDGMGTYSYADFREWRDSVAGVLGLVADGSAASNIAILHADMPVRAAVPSDISATVPTADDVRTAIEYADVATVVVNIVATGNDLSALEIPAIPDEEQVCEGMMRGVVADIGQKRAVSLYDLYELYLSGIREDDRKFMYALRCYIAKWDEHPKYLIARLKGYSEAGDRFVERVSRVSRSAAWSMIQMRGDYLERFVLAFGQGIMVYPEYKSGGGGVKPRGNGHHHVSAARSRRACSKVKAGGSI